MAELASFYELLPSDNCIGVYMIIGSIVGALTIWIKHII